MSYRESCDVGITEYLGSHEGFSGIIKMRFQDFIVNEIDEEGNVVHLTDMNLPKSEDSPQETNHTDSSLSEDDLESIAEFVRTHESDHIIIKTGESKEERTKTHQAIRFLYPELESQTITSEDGAKVIKVTTAKKGSRSNANRTRRPRKSLCKFVLHKQNIGTMEAINFIAKKLHIHKANGFQYAGTKDKRGVTTQLITAPVAAERLKGLNKLDCNIKVGNFRYCSKPLQLGALNGNLFSVVLRNVTKTDCKSSFESFSKNGFINYYGLQRFGTTSIPTHAVGIAILKSDWKKVIDLILTPRDNECNSNLNEALNKYQENSDPDEALQCLRYKGSIEGILLQGLKRFGESQLLQAITVLPRNTRKMYVHAYQSYVWNTVASKRIRELGDKPCTGDLVFMKTYKDRTESQVEEPPLKRQCLDGKPESCTPASVVPLSNEDVHRFTLHDVILPLPGHDIMYPENECKSWYKQVMEEHGIDIDRHMIHKVKDYSLPGDYRHLVTIPSKAEFELVRYDDFSIPLLQTDMEKMDDSKTPSTLNEGNYLAARLSFSLPPSSYATIALRELMKTDISLSAQMKLNEQHGAREHLSKGEKIEE